MAKNDYDNWNKQQLIDEIRVLKRHKRYGLVWKDQPEQVATDCETNLPVLEEVKKYAIATDANTPTNLMIEGDNYHALSVLNYTHKGKIDVIYIDPPYNTGAKNWTYNNHFVDEHNSFRHSKFISFIRKRIKLSKKLLSRKGIIICAIDDHEVHNVRHVLDEIFGENNRLGTIVAIHKPGGRQDDDFFATAHEYMLVYARDSKNATIGLLDLSEKKLLEFKHADEWGKYKRREYRRSGANSRREDRPNLWYPIYINPNTLDLSTDRNEFKNAIKLLPIDPKNIARVWRWNAETLMKKRGKYTEVLKKGDEIRIYVKERESDYLGLKPTTLWHESYYSSSVGTDELKNVLGKKFKGEKIFDYPKSKFLVRDIIKIASDKNSLILDFFAGSGTTASAVLELNKKDNGRRTFIVCTNNEDNNARGKKIARDICYPRIKNVIKGYTTPNNVQLDGTGGNLKYYKTTFVSASMSDDNKAKITQKIADMLCVRENTFEEVKICQSYRIYRNDSRHTGIIYAESAIANFKKCAAKIRGKFHIYVFSLGKEDYAEEFTDMSGKVQTHPVPEEILRAYRQTFQKRNIK